VSKDETTGLHQPTKLPASNAGPNLFLVSGDLWSGNNVALEVVVDVGGVTRVSGLDVAWDLGRNRGLAGTSSSNLDLRARNVELGWRAGVVDAELLDAEEVLAGGNLARNGDGVCGCAVISIRSVILTSELHTTHIPLGLAGGEVGTDLLDLEPISRAIS